MGGCFDILHIGHIRALKKAKKLGDILVVGINNDSFIKQSKGAHRPIISEKQRAEILMNLKSVDHVFITNKALYDDDNLAKIKPDYLIFGVEKDKMQRRKKIAKHVEEKFPHIKTKFLWSGINNIRTTLIEDKIIKNKL